MDTALLPPLATAGDYAAMAGPQPDGLDVEALLAAASGIIRAYCGWHISPVLTEDITVGGTGSALIMLPTMALVDVAAVTDSGVTLDPALYSWATDGRVQRESRSPFGYVQGFSTALRGVVVTITHGFDSVPEVANLAVTMAARSAASPAGITQESTGGMSVSYGLIGSGMVSGISLLPHEKALLDTYRLPRRC